MEPVEVTAHWDGEGNVTPREFTWKGARYPVESTGRSWIDLAGFHVLVMATAGHVYELALNAGDFRWYLRPTSQHPHTV